MPTGAKKGNTNARKGDIAMDATINIRCTVPQKATWIELASESNMTLSEWIKAVLDSVS